MVLQQHMSCFLYNLLSSGNNRSVTRMLRHRQVRGTVTRGGGMGGGTRGVHRWL